MYVQMKSVLAFFFWLKTKLMIFLKIRYFFPNIWWFSASGNSGDDEFTKFTGQRWQKIVSRLTFYVIALLCTEGRLKKVVHRVNGVFCLRGVVFSLCAEIPQFFRENRNLNLWTVQHYQLTFSVLTGKMTPDGFCTDDRWNDHLSSCGVSFFLLACH